MQPQPHAAGAAEVVVASAVASTRRAESVPRAALTLPYLSCRFPLVPQPCGVVPPVAPWAITSRAVNRATQEYLRTDCDQQTCGSADYVFAGTPYWIIANPGGRNFVTCGQRAQAPVGPSGP